MKNKECSFCVNKEMFESTISMPCETIANIVGAIYKERVKSRQVIMLANPSTYKPLFHGVVDDAVDAMVYAMSNFMGE